MSDAADVRTCEAVRPTAAVKLYSGSDNDSATTEAGESCKALADNITVRNGDIIAADDGFKIAAIFGGHKRSVLFRSLPKAQALGRSRFSSQLTRSRALASFEYYAAVQNALLSGSQRAKISSQISSQLVLTQRTPLHALFSVDGCATILPSDLPHRPPPSSLRAFKINNRQAAMACVGE
ncbi:hypothetical protein ACE103_00235 [Bradyrhizobium sp. ma5]|uniref:hypothetical protein n=1 Tax=Bradyrhizobium sp. ma5 TaxID=3344828 RepID=UPI0035D42876